MRTAKETIENAFRPGHFVVVTDNVNLQFPLTLWKDHDYHSDEDLEKAREQAASQVERTSILGRNLGFGIFQRRGMASYRYEVYAIVQGKALNVGLAGKAKEVEAVVRSFHAKYESRAAEDLLEELDRELSRHDWYAAMSDAPGVWSAGERHIDEVIRPLLAYVPREQGLALWQKHAPEGCVRDPYEG